MALNKTNFGGGFAVRNRKGGEKKKGKGSRKEKG